MSERVLTHLERDKEERAEWVRMVEKLQAERDSLREQFKFVEGNLRYTEQAVLKMEDERDALAAQVEILTAALEKIAAAEEDWAASDSGFSRVQAVADAALQPQPQEPPQEGR